MKLRYGYGSAFELHRLYECYPIIFKYKIYKYIKGTASCFYFFFVYDCLLKL